MSFRVKVFLSITATVVVAVWIVAAVVSTLVTRSFERRDGERTAALVSQFRREFDRRGAEVARRIDAIANSEAIQRMAVNLGGSEPDANRYFDQAQALAREQSLNFLDLVGPDGRIISSAEWPARFGYQESWLTEQANWKSAGTFLKREDLADGSALGLITVRTLKAGERTLYIAGGLELDKDFLDSLPSVEAMRVQLVRNFEPLPPPESLGSKLTAALVEAVRKQPREVTRTGTQASITALPLLGRDQQLLAILLVESSRAELASLKNYIQGTAWTVGGGGVLLGLMLSLWTASRVTRPLRELTASVREVAGGNWNARATVESSDEVGQLARNFNQMTQQLAEQRDRMIQAERVAAWRELARRLAHELKNPLFPLQLTVENLQRARDASPEQFDEVFRESTTTLLAELDNLKTIIGRFSDFAKMPAPHLEPVDLNQTARDVVKLFDAQIHAPGRPPVEVRFDTQDNLATVRADPDQIRRALRNLILNALDAMPNGGTLAIRTESLNGAGQGKVALEISDTGEGLTPEECERLFTPYYTTKQHGTGLGLAIVQSVVSDHKGTITVHSQPGKGTTFRIELNA
ncbi:MAG: HAMP domain-containing protein [Acidobacteriia bacterium]|nr:HAMP domain-containing protein [Terriglobia bacterium]